MDTPELFPLWISGTGSAILGISCEGKDGTVRRQRSRHACVRNRGGQWRASRRIRDAGLVNGNFTAGGYRDVKGVGTPRGTETPRDVLAEMEWIERTQQEYQIRLLNISRWNASKRGRRGRNSRNFLARWTILWDRGIMVVAAASNT